MTWRAWLADAQSFEAAHTFFGAVLRDYARLGRLLAHDGAWEGKQIIPAWWMIEATIKAHVSAILQKLGVESRTQAVIAAAKISGGQWRQGTPTT